MSILTPSDASAARAFARNFPPEVIDRIIDFLWDTPAMLMDCALISKTWLPSSLYHLYMNHCDTISSEGPLQAMVIQAQHSRRLADHIAKCQFLNIDANFSNPHYPPLKAAWPHRIPFLLPSLYRNLHELSLSSLHFADRISSPDTWGRHGGAQWRHITSLKLFKIRFRSLAGFQRLLRGFRSLRKIHMRTIACDDLAQPQAENAVNLATMVSSGPTLSELFVDAFPEEAGDYICRWLLNGNSADSMARLSLRWVDESTSQGAMQLFVAVAPNLTSLLLSYNGNSPYAHDVILPVHHRALSQCSTKLLQLSLERMNDDQCVAILKSLSSSCRVQELDLDISQDQEPIDWAPIQTALDQPQFSELKLLRIHFQYGSEVVLSEDEFKEGSPYASNRALWPLTSSLRARNVHGCIFASLTVCTHSIYDNKDVYLWQFDK